MRIAEVTSRKLQQDFLALPHVIYKNDPDWICPLEAEIDAIFDPKQNSFFAHGTCTRWVLYQDNRCIGRIAAFINYRKTEKEKAGGAGFFECIDNQQAADLLFDTAKAWLQQKGMQAMDAPINFGENDKYWGLLIDGFKPPSLGMNYNPPYYIPLFENYGFKKNYDQFTNFLDATTPMPERFTRISDWIMQKPQYSFKHFNKKEFDRFAQDFQEIYNDAWVDFDHFTPIDMGSIKDSFRQMEAIMDEKIIWFAYHDNEPIAFILCLPDVK